MVWMDRGKDLIREIEKIGIKKKICIRWQKRCDMQEARLERVLRQQKEEIIKVSPRNNAFKRELSGKVLSREEGSLAGEKSSHVR